MLERIYYFLVVFLSFHIFDIPRVFGQTYNDSNAKIEDRVKDLMSKMTLEEKIGQMCQFVAPAHIEKTKRRLKGEELIYNDQWGTYPGLNSEKLKQKVKNGEIGSFLPVSYTHLTLPTNREV